MTRRHRILAFALLLVFAACKNTEDYLRDIRLSQEQETGHLNLGVYDAGLLIHEGLTGLMDQESLTLSQMGRAVHDAGWLLEKNEVALLRADAVSLLAHLALRWPLPPASEAFREDKNVGEIAARQIDALEAAGVPLTVETEIELIDNPDKAVAEHAHFQLRKITGQEFPRDSAPWSAWWEANKEATLRKAETESREPIRILADLRYASLASSRAILGYVATRVGLIDLPGLREDTTRAIVRIARHVVVNGILRAIQDKDPAVRSAAFRAAAEVLDPAFADGLQFQFARETEGDARIQLLQALSWYPSKGTFAALLLALRHEDRALNIQAYRILVPMCGVDFGLDAGAWLLWFEREGRQRWP